MAVALGGMDRGAAVNREKGERVCNRVFGGKGARAVAICSLRLGLAPGTGRVAA